MTAADLAALKAAHPLAEIVARYANSPRRVNGRIFWLCPFHDERTPSFSITPDGGAFKCFGCGARGDVIEFVMRAEGLDFKAALEFLGGNAPSISPAKSHPLPQHDSNDLARRIEAALGIWHSASPATGTLVEVYLRGRGLTMPIPPTIRYVPSLQHTPTGQLFPAMVAAVQGPDRQIRGIHRTYLRLDGKGKAALDEPKMMLGCCAQGAVRLARAGPRLAIGEGIESSLSVLQETNIPAWAALSTSGMMSLVLPSSIHDIILCRDPDEPGEKAANEAAQRFISESRKVWIACPPKGKDFNDTLIATQRLTPIESSRSAYGG